MSLNKIEKLFLIFILNIFILIKAQFIINILQLKFTQKRLNKLLTLYYTLNIILSSLKNIIEKVIIFCLIILEKANFKDKCYQKFLAINFKNFC